MKDIKFDIQRFVETINGTAGNDTITVNSAETIVRGYSGHDTIYNEYGNVTIDGGDGADSITRRSLYYGNLTDNVSIVGGAGNDLITVCGSNSTISGDNGDDYISVSRGNNNSINGGIGNDTVNSSGDGAKIFGGNGLDSIKSYGANVTIWGESDNDIIYSNGNANVIYADVGDDSIQSENNTNGSILGGAGNDSITVRNGNNVTVIGGANNDNIDIYRYNDTAALIYYANGDGNDIVNGFNENDTLKINGSYSTVASDNNVIVNVGSGKITLVGAAGSSLNIQSTSSSAPATTPAVTPTTPTVTPETVAPATPTVTPVTVAPSTNSSSYVYSGGNATISAGVSSGTSSVNNYYEQINFATELRSFSVSGDNIYLHSNSGTLTVRNARGSYMKYAGSDGAALAYSYIGVSGSSYSSVSNSYKTIDERNHYSYFGVIIGGDNINDMIFAGAGGSSMWGGNGGNDTLVGGDGYDEFFYIYGNGNDSIFSAGAEDVINVNGVSFEQFTSAEITDNGVNATFTDGGSLNINGRAGTFILGGQRFGADYQNKSWYVK